MCRLVYTLKKARHADIESIVANDHRVGIFEKERIKAGVKLFNDYGYACDHTPVWALKPYDPQEALQLHKLKHNAQALKPKQVPHHVNNHNHKITLHMFQYALLQLWQHDDHQQLSISICLGFFRHTQMLKVAGDHRVGIFSKIEY